MHQTNFEYDLRGILFKIYFNRKSYSPIIRFGETVKSLSLVESFFSPFVQTIFILTGNQHNDSFLKLSSHLLYLLQRI